MSIMLLKQMTTKNLENIFNTEETKLPTTIISAEVVEDKEVFSSSIKKEIKPKLTDSAYIRKSLKTTLEKSQEALNLILDEVRLNVSNPRNIEVLSKLTDSISKLVGQLTELNSKEKDVEIKLDERENTELSKESNYTQNNLIISTNDVLDRIMKGINPPPKEEE